jgi:spermidine synthase
LQIRLHNRGINAEREEISRNRATGISALVLCCFFLSGLTGLMYEILWTRMIVKIIGSAPFAVTIVLTVFMGGLGLGSFLAGRTIDRVQDPRRLIMIYGVLELAIGVYGLILPGLLIAFRPLYAVLYNQLFDHFTFYNLLTFVGCSLLLLIPVTCMGATLPVLCRFYVAKLAHLGTRVGRLYGLNTIGAAFGSLLCGFWIINLFGVRGTLIFAVLFNGLIGGSCLVAGYKLKIGMTGLVSYRETVTEETPTVEAAGHRVGALVIFGVSGFCAMAYEVIWTKLLGLIVGPTTYSFTIVLVTFIAGLALGSVIFGWLADRRKEAVWLLIYTQLAAALLALVVSHVLGNSQFFFAKLIYQFKGQFAQLALSKAIILFGFMLWPTICLGATFPLVGKIYTESLSQVGRSIGFAYMINTLGAVLGSFCAGFLLVPLIGKEQGLSLIIGIQVVTSFGVGGYLLLQRKETALRWIPLAIPALLGLLLLLYFPDWNRHLLSEGKYHRFEAIDAKIRGHGWFESLWHGSKILAESRGGSELLYYGDGIGGFTTVLKKTDAFGNVDYYLLNSGKTDASSRGDMATQTLSAHLPLLFHPNPKMVMVVGLASGITAGEALYYPIERLDVIEISDQVVSASDFFTPWNNNVLSNPKTELIIQDGRAHLQLTNRKYDVIISEPSNPWMAGLASLFTREFFTLVRDRLNADGIFVQWVAAYQMDWPTFALIGRSFLQVFPQSLLVATSELGWDYLLVGFKGDKGLKLDHAEQNLSYTQQSRNVTLSNPKLLFRLIVSEDLESLFGPGPVNTDNWPRLEFTAPKMMHTKDPMIKRNIESKKWLSHETGKIVSEFTTDVDAQIDFAAYHLSVYRPFHNMVDISRATRIQRERFFKLVENYCNNNLVEDCSIFTDEELRQRCCSIQIEALQHNIDQVPNKALVHNIIGNFYIVKGEHRQAIAAWQRALAADRGQTDESAIAHNNLGNVYSSSGMLKQAISEYRKALAIDPDYWKAYNNLGVAYLRKGMLDEAIDEYKKSITLNPDYSEAHNNLGIAYGKKGMLDEAISELKKAVTTNPNHLKAHINLGVAYMRRGMLDEAIDEFKKSITLNPDYSEAHNNLGIAYGKKGMLDEAIDEFKKALAIDPKLAAAHENLAIAYYYKGLPERALEHYQKAIDLGMQIDSSFLEALKRQ